ncbi:MotA/TolQ/ExbB proton channel family protein [Sinimarinibacterium sp. CAU 1509]|uniref:MotA/TolQ/ExbB proton channel family protein n=1 Tax=Sinimarinibacterium sp. CAU 1509 TaxID=2562283 RepID=UPI0010AD6CDF|nr:MotA/TolQ/ExbB proton channel family protein [Sinimarinibacterium sp. CAU 1509]TJY60984.1 MotA/TolQ/ExbB proton channel family protein [Sinimarinibacterium sp. CAU 1509]
MEFFATVIRFFQSGGAFMYPILLVMIIGLAIAAERALYLRRANAENRLLWSELLPLLNQGKREAAEQLATNSETAIGRVLGFGLARARANAARSEIEMAMEESIMEVTPLLERRTHYLATFANIATLLGLLGTIIGLIAGFNAVANVNPAEKANLLSSSISVAMNTTAFGLIVAIPLLLAHAWLQSKANDLVDSVEMAAIKFLNSLGLKD